MANLPCRACGKDGDAHSTQELEACYENLRQQQDGDEL